MPGEGLYITDAFSRAPTSTSTQPAWRNVQSYVAVETYIDNLAASYNSLDKFKRAQDPDDWVQSYFTINRWLAGKEIPAL